MFLLLSFVAGLLTVLAPCILPMLPIIVGGTLARGGGMYRSYTVLISLALSLLIFTLLLKASTALIFVPDVVWTYVSGGIILCIGLSFMLGDIWTRLLSKTRLALVVNRWLGAGARSNTFWGDVLVGVALGPVFATCSPTYFIIIGTVLPANWALGVLYLLAYILGVSFVLLMITMLGDRVLSRFVSLSDPNGIFKKLMGGFFIVIGFAIICGYDKQWQTFIIDADILDITRLEEYFLMWRNN